VIFTQKSPKIFFAPYPTGRGDEPACQKKLKTRTFWIDFCISTYKTRAIRAMKGAFLSASPLRALYVSIQISTLNV